MVTEHCPIPAEESQNQSRYVVPAYSEVDAAFKDYTFSHPLKGQFRRLGKPAYNFRKRNISSQVTSAETHVRTIYTSEQLKYIHIMQGLLNGMINGKILFSDRNPPKKLSRRIEERYLSNFVRGQFLYADALVPELINTFSLFQRYYPSMMPAVANLFNREGLSSLDVHSVLNATALYDALNHHEFKGKGEDHEHFVGYGHVHQEEGPYQIHCPAESFVRHAIVHVKSAAKTLGQYSFIKRSYSQLYNPISQEVNARVVDSFVGETDHLIKKLSTKSKRMHARGTL